MIILIALLLDDLLAVVHDDMSTHLTFESTSGNAGRRLSTFDLQRIEEVSFSPAPYFPFFVRDLEQVISCRLIFLIL